MKIRNASIKCGVAAALAVFCAHAAQAQVRPVASAAGGGRGWTPPFAAQTPAALASLNNVVSALTSRGLPLPGGLAGVATLDAGSDMHLRAVGALASSFPEGFDLASAERLLASPNATPAQAQAVAASLSMAHALATPAVESLLRTHFRYLASAVQESRDETGLRAAAELGASDDVAGFSIFGAKAGEYAKGMVRLTVIARIDPLGQARKMAAFLTENYHDVVDLPVLAPFKPSRSGLAKPTHYEDVEDAASQPGGGSGSTVPGMTVGHGFIDAVPRAEKKAPRFKDLLSEDTAIPMLLAGGLAFGANLFSAADRVSEFWAWPLRGMIVAAGALVTLGLVYAGYWLVYAASRIRRTGLRPPPKPRPVFHVWPE